MEIVSITTAMNPDGDNPLEPYLDEGQFPFPVLYDESGVLAHQLGVNALPFWVFTGPDGVVLGRMSGYLQPEVLATFFEQLEAVGAET
jgi:thioredoxin-related protein